jgi:hypothetical protein
MSSRSRASRSPVVQTVISPRVVGTPTSTALRATCTVQGHAVNVAGRLRALLKPARHPPEPQPAEERQNDGCRSLAVARAVQRHSERARHRHPTRPWPCRFCGASRRQPPGKGGPSGIARGETAQVLTVASGRSADRSRATAMGRRPGSGRWPYRAGRRGLPGGASSPARQGVTDSPRSLRIFADHLSETAQVTGAGRLTCVGAAGEPKLAPLRRASVWAFPG